MHLRFCGLDTFSRNAFGAGQIWLAAKTNANSAAENNAYKQSPLRRAFLFYLLHNIMNNQQIDEIVAKWTGVRFLENYSGDPVCLATCLHAQMQTNDPKNIGLLPLVRRLFGESRCLQRNHFHNYFETKEQFKQQMFFKTKYKHGNSLDEMAENLVEMSAAIALELDKTFGDLTNTSVVFYGFEVLDNNAIVMTYGI